MRNFHAFQVFPGWFLHCKHTNSKHCPVMSSCVAATAPTLLTTPQPDRGIGCHADFWWAPAQAATFSQAEWGSELCGGLWATLGFSVVSRRQTRPLIFGRLFSSAHGHWLFFQLQLLLILDEADESPIGMSPSFEPGDGDALRTCLRQLRRDRPHSG